MLKFPNAKINLGLNVVSKRPDGYHNLETVFYPVELKDSLEIIESETDAFYPFGIPVEGNSEHNLVLKALFLLREDYPVPPLDVYLYKSIPTGAGMGGGSSDASFMLKMINEKFDFQIPDSVLEKYAVKLGADCPFFIKNTPVFATGIGNEFHETDFSMQGLFIVIVKPDIHVSTGLAFSRVKPELPEKKLTELISQPISTWKDSIKNDFEESVFYYHPEIRAVKDQLYEQGAIYAAMSGSGASVYGIFEKQINLKHLFQPFFYWSGYLR